MKQLNIHKNSIPSASHPHEEDQPISKSFNNSHKLRQRSPQPALGSSIPSGKKAQMDFQVHTQDTGDLAIELVNGDTASNNSHYMQDVVGVFKALIHDIFPCEQKMTGSPALDCLFVSSVYGTVVESGLDAAKVSSSYYWIDNLVSSARFLEAITSIRVSCSAISGESNIHILGMTPPSILRSMTQDLLCEDRNEEDAYSSIWSQQQPAINTAMELAGRLHCLGYPVDLVAVNQLRSDEDGKSRTLGDLPPYPFDHSRDYWLESRVSKGYRLRHYPYNEFVGTMASDWNPLEPHWNNRLVLRQDSYLHDHKVIIDCLPKSNFTR